MASGAPRMEATICMSGSASTQRLIMARTTTASSTTMTRSRSRSRTEAKDGAVTAIVIFRSSTRTGGSPRSDQSDFLELRFDNLLIEGLHDVFIGPRVERAGNVRDIILAGAEHHFRAIAVRQPAKRAQELVPVHLGHVPVEQHGVGHLTAAGFERLLAILGFRDFEFQTLENATRYFANHARIIDYQAVFHHILASCHTQVSPRLPGITRHSLMPPRRWEQSRARDRDRAPP